MAARWGIPEWRRLYRTLTADLTVGCEAYHPGEAAVNAAAERFETATGYRLPMSYKAFARVFGPGELGGYYRVAIPGDAKLGYDLAAGHQLMRDLFADDVADEQGRLRARLLTFAETIGGETVGWDPLDVTDPAGPEYRVYYVTRGGSARGVAASFPEFVTDICLKDRLHEFFGWENQGPADWPPRRFLPYRTG